MSGEKTIINKDEAIQLVHSLFTHSSRTECHKKEVMDSHWNSRLKYKREREGKEGSKKEKRKGKEKDTKRKRKREREKERKKREK